MPTYDVEVRIRQDGTDIVGSPFIRRITLTEGTTFDTDIPSSQSAQGAIPGAPLTGYTFLFLNPQNTLAALINNGSAITLNPGAMLLILDTAVSQSTAAEAISVANGTGVAVEVLGLEAGS